MGGGKKLFSIRGCGRMNNGYGRLTQRAFCGILNSIFRKRILIKTMGGDENDV